MPIIAYDCPTGPRHIITHNDDGFLVQDGDLNTLVKYINFLIENIAERKLMGANAYENCLRLKTEAIMTSWKVLIS